MLRLKCKQSICVPLNVGNYCCMFESMVFQVIQLNVKNTRRLEQHYKCCTPRRLVQAPSPAKAVRAAFFTLIQDLPVALPHCPLRFPRGHPSDQTSDTFFWELISPGPLRESAGIPHPTPTSFLCQPWLFQMHHEKSQHIICACNFWANLFVGNCHPCWNTAIEQNGQLTESPY